MAVVQLQDPLPPNTALDLTVSTAPSREPAAGYGQEHARVIVTYWVPWAHRHAAKRALLGMTFFEPNPSPFLSRWLPHKLDWNGDEWNDKGDDWLYCKTVEAVEEEQIDKEENDIGPRYKKAYLRATYEASPFEYLDDEDVRDSEGKTDESSLARYVDYDTKSRARVMSARGGSLVFADPNNPTTPVLNSRGQRIPVFFGSLLPISEAIKTFVWMSVPRKNFPFAAADSAMNKTNASAWTTVFGTFPKETMLLEDWQPIWTRLPDGTRGLHARFIFKFFNAGTVDAPKGWNYLPRPDAGNQFHPVIGADGTTRMISTFDPRTLFRPVAG